MKTRRNTAAMPTDVEAKRRLQKLIDRLPLPPGANATVISARVRPYEYSGDYHDEEGHTLEYEVGGYTDLDADSALARYRDHDLHRIVSDALGVRRGDEEALLEDTDVLRDGRTLRDYPGFSVVWSGTLLDRSTIHTDDGDKRADAVSEVRAGKRNADFMQKLLADMKANPRARRVSTAVLGERVRVFRNLHTQTWSMESATTGRIIAHPDTVLLEDVRLISRDAGREKTRRTGAKNVHAVASGTLVAIDGPAPADLDRWTPLYYNPFNVDTFVEFVDGKVGKPVRGSRMWFAAADHRSQYALAPQKADPGRYKKLKAPRRENGFLASLALVGIGMAAGVYVEEQKGVAARVRSSLKGKDKVAREQFDRLKRGVLEAQPKTSAPPPVKRTALVTDATWSVEEEGGGKGNLHTRRIAGLEYVVFERNYGKGNKVTLLDLFDPNGKHSPRLPGGEGANGEGWKSVSAAKKAAEKHARA